MRRSLAGPLQIGTVILILACCVGLYFLNAMQPPQPAPAAQDARSLCEARGDWWDDQDKVCAVPVPLSSLTGRPNPTAK